MARVRISVPDYQVVRSDRRRLSSDVVANDKLPRPVLLAVCPDPSTTRTLTPVNVAVVFRRYASSIPLLSKSHSLSYCWIRGHNELRGTKVLDRGTHGLEENDLIRPSPSHGPT